MKLYLVRHGKALPSMRDSERSLSEEGREEVAHVASFLEACGVRASRVAHSGKARAAQTADILAGALAPGTGTETAAGLRPTDPVGPVAEEAALWAEDVMLVGHLPFMARLVSLLLAGDEERVGVGYRPGTVVCLEREGGRGWRISWVVQPDLLAGRRSAPAP